MCHKVVGRNAFKNHMNNAHADLSVELRDFLSEKSVRTTTSRAKDPLFLMHKEPWKSRMGAFVEKHSSSNDAALQVDEEQSSQPTTPVAKEWPKHRPADRTQLTKNKFTEDLVDKMIEICGVGKATKIVKSIAKGERLCSNDTRTCMQRLATILGLIDPDKTRRNEEQTMVTPSTLLASIEHLGDKELLKINDQQFFWLQRFLRHETLSDKAAQRFSAARLKESERLNAIKEMKDSMKVEMESETADGNGVGSPVSARLSSKSRKCEMDSDGSSSSPPNRILPALSRIDVDEPEIKIRRVESEEIEETPKSRETRTQSSPGTSFIRLTPPPPPPDPFEQYPDYPEEPLPLVRMGADGREEANPDAYLQMGFGWVPATHPTRAAWMRHVEKGVDTSGITEPMELILKKYPNCQDPDFKFISEERGRSPSRERSAGEVSSTTSRSKSRSRSPSPSPSISSPPLCSPVVES